MGRLSMLATVRRHTTRTPNGLTSKAKLPVRFSIAPNAAPIAVAPGTCGRAGLPVTKMITPDFWLIMCRAAARARDEVRLHDRGQRSIPLPYTLERAG